MDAEKKYFFNGKKIKDVQLLTVVPGISASRDYNFLKTQLENYIDEFKGEKRYCLNLSEIKNIDYISNSISLMMAFQRYCVTRKKETFFISHPTLKPHLENSQLMDTLFRGDVFDSVKDLDTFLSK